MWNVVCIYVGCIWDMHIHEMWVLFFIFVRIHPFILVSASTHICVFRGQRTTLAISPYIPICLNGASCCFATVYTRLAGPQISCLCFRLYLGTLGLQMDKMIYVQTRGIQSQALNPLSHLSCSFLCEWWVADPKGAGHFHSLSGVKVLGTWANSCAPRSGLPK